MKKAVSFLASATLILTIGCGDGQPTTEPTPETQAKLTAEAAHDHHHDHAHVAPNGGTLVEIGDHFAHVEFLLRPEEKKLVAFILDGHAENPVRITQESINLTIKPDDAEAFELQLLAVANTLTGETIGDTSQFEAVSDKLDGLEHFDVTISAISVRGTDISDLMFPFPEGNEAGAEHDH